ncbi:MAG: class A beta-lactamase-related serine hydrolase, partial [Burkholderiales bacterium]
MSKQALKSGFWSLLTAVSLLLVTACSHDAPPTADVSALTATKPYNNPAWPAAAVADPTALGFSAEGLQALDTRMKEAVDKGELAGISYALVKDGQVAAFKFHGGQSLGGRPMQEDSLIRIRSIGKTITAVAMMQLWEQGKWKPEDPITKFLPELANLKVATPSDTLDNLVPVSHVPTMHELMTHTAGFGYGLSQTNAVERAFAERGVTNSKDSKALVDAVAGIPLQLQPGQRWAYSIAYDLQGPIIERITGKRLGDYLAENVFTPLAMNDTRYWLTEADRPRVATVYTRNASTGTLEPFLRPADDPFDKYRNYDSGGGGASGLYSTLHDYVRFTQMLLNKGELGGNRILKPETVAFMTQNHIGDLKGVFGGDGYGFGYGGRVSLDGPTETTAQPKGSLSHFSIEGAWYW